MIRKILLASTAGIVGAMVMGATPAAAQAACDINGAPGVPTAGADIHSTQCGFGTNVGTTFDNTAVGFGTTATGGDSVGVGAHASATGQDSVSIGYFSSATVANAV